MICMPAPRGFGRSSLRAWEVLTHVQPELPPDGIDGFSVRIFLGMVPRNQKVVLQMPKLCSAAAIGAVIRERIEVNKKIQVVTGMPRQITG